jgi:autotransporter-associated beta strand protein
MIPPVKSLTLFLGTSLTLCHITSADVIYSNLLNTPIPLNFDGVTINIGNGEINPFFGGYAVANDADLQPFRLGTGGLDTIRNFSHGAFIDTSTISLATGPGGSQDHLGTTYTSGQEGYMGFKLDNDKFGWARVIFTNNTGGAMIKDWSYDTSGSGITVGGIRQVAQNIEISANFTLSSSLVNSGGTTNLVSSNSGTTTLSANHTYTGTTTINSGSTLIINGATTTTTITANGTLGGSGNHQYATLGGSGTIAPGTGSTPGILTAAAINPASGADFAFEFTSANNPPDWSNPFGSGNDVVHLTGEIPFSSFMDATNIVNIYLNVASLNSGDTFTGGFYSDEIADFLSQVSGATYQYHLFNGSTFDLYNGPLSFDIDTSATAANFGNGIINGYAMRFTAIPEPSATVLLLISPVFLFRRRGR